MRRLTTCPMPLLDDSLTIWEIGIRWAGKNPALLSLRIPTEVKDNFRLVVRAIADGDLYCGTLTNNIDSTWPKDLIRYTAEAIEACIDGKRYDRKFLKQHSILRWEFAQWCEKAGIPFPEFWFPPGWITDEPGYPASLRKTAEPKALPSADAKVSPAVPEPQNKPRNNEAIWLQVEAAAKAIWAEAGSIPSAEVARRIKAMKGMSGSRFFAESIRKRIAKLAPPDRRGKPGRPKGKKSV